MDLSWDVIEDYKTSHEKTINLMRMIADRFIHVVFGEHDELLIVVLLFYVLGKHLRSCRDGQLT